MYLANADFSLYFTFKVLNIEIYPETTEQREQSILHYRESFNPYYDELQNINYNYNVVIEALIVYVDSTVKYGKNKKNKKKLMLKTNLYFYSDKKYNTPSEDLDETRQAYKRLKHVKMGDYIVLRYPFPDILEFPDHKSGNFIRNKGRVIEFQELIKGVYPFRIDDIFIHRCTFFKRLLIGNMPTGLTQFGLKPGNKISRFWSDMQLKLPIIPHIQYYVFHKSFPAISKLKATIHIICVTALTQLTLFSDVTDRKNMWLFVLFTIIGILNQFIIKDN